MNMSLSIMCDSCGRLFHNPAYTAIDQADTLRAEARAAGWTGDMNRLSTKDKCERCTPPPAPPPAAQPGALPQALRTAALPVDDPYGGLSPHQEPHPDKNEQGFDGHKESKS